MVRVGTLLTGLVGVFGTGLESTVWYGLVSSLQTRTPCFGTVW